MGIAEESLGKLLEAEYRQQRAKAADDLYNALAGTLNEQRPSIETALYVLESIKANLVNRERAAKAPPPAESARVPEKIGWRETRERMEATPPGD